jgi:hypothetical protein
VNAALRARVVDGHLLLLGSERLPEGMEFELVPVAERPPANDDTATLLALLACDLPDEAFAGVLDRPDDPARDPAL